MKLAPPAPRPLGLASVALALAGCISQSSAIEGDDATFFPGARLSLPIGDGPSTLEVDLADSDGRFEQTLGAGETVRLESVTFTGPGVVDVELDLARAYVGGRSVVAEEDGLGVSLLLGLGFTQLDAVAAFGGAKDDLSAGALGLIGGLEGFYRLGEHARVYAELTYLPGLSGGYDAVELTTFDLGLAVAPSAHVELAAGWRTWTYEAEAVGIDSDLDLTLRGPHVSVRISP